MSVRTPIQAKSNSAWAIGTARRTAAIAFVATVFVMAWGAPLFAAAEGGSLVNSTAGAVFRWINFAIVAALAVYFFVKVAGPAFRGNTRRIQSAIAEGTRAREAAEQSRRAAAQKLAGLDAEITAMKAEAEKSARSEAEKIRAQAQADAEKIDLAATAEIDAAERAARMELRQWVAGRVVARAEGLLRDQVTSAADGALVKGFIEGLGGEDELSALSQRYAAALADVALAHKATAAIRGELTDVAAAYKESSDLRNLLSNPAVSAEVKKSLLAKLAERMQLSQAMRNFLFVLVDHHRVELLSDLLPAYDSEVHARMGIAEARVTSAHELSGQEKHELTAALERLTQKKVEAQFAVADSLLGGAVVQIGSTIYDGSVRQQLESLRTTLESE